MRNKVSYPYLAFVLTAETREYLLELIKPRHELRVAHHVTLVSPDRFQESDRYLFDQTPDVFVYGVARTANIDAIAVQVNQDRIRPDGVFYHVTLSHVAHYKAVQARETQPHIQPWTGPSIALAGSVKVLTRYA